MIYRWLQRVWYDGAVSGIVLVPLAWLFGAIVALRRWAYRAGVLRSVAVGVPVIVVGNLTVGGTGKTPLTLWLAGQLRERGPRVGIAMRGHGGSANEPRLVSPTSAAADVGDEPALIARRQVATVAVGHDRVAVARLLEQSGCQIVIADDGLQHLRLRRQFEIVVVDAARRFGNGRLLPAGPLREPLARLQTVDAVVLNGAHADATGRAELSDAEVGTPGGLASPSRSVLSLTLVAGDAVSVRDPSVRRPLSTFAGRQVHALAAIGNPARFFATLRESGIEPIEHPLPDHAPLVPGDILFNDERAVLMTEKDAVKCAGLADARHWYVPVEAQLPAVQAAGLLERVCAL